MLQSTFADSDFFYFSRINFKNITVSLKKVTLQENNVVDEEELDCTDRDDLGNLEDSPRLVFIHEECGNLIVVNDGGELTENVYQKNSDVLQQPAIARRLTFFLFLLSSLVTGPSFKSMSPVVLEL